jgi:polysaccharide biosynthesis transport protein
MLARREPERVIQMARVDPEQDSWYEYKTSNMVVPDEGYLQRYLAALYRHRRLALAVVVLVILSAVGYLLVATPVYEADVRVLIEPDNPNVVSFKEVIQGDVSKLEYYQTQMEILRSRSLARKTLDALDMWKDREIVQPEGQIGAAIGRARSVFNRLTGRSSSPSASGPADGAVSTTGTNANSTGTASNETATQSRAIDEFLKRLVLNYRADNRILEVGYLSVDPRHAAEVANTIARTYIDDSMDVKFKAAKEASDWLNERIAEQRKQVEASETAAQRYREANGDVAVSAEQSIVVQKLSDLNTAATKAKTERLDAEALYQQLQTVAVNPSGLDTLPIILSDPFIQKLKAELADLQGQERTMSMRYGDRYPDLQKLRTAIEGVQQQIRAEVRKIAESVGNQYRAALAKERSLTGALEEQKRLALTQDRRAVQYNELAREATSNRQMFESLLQRAKETGLASELKTSNIRIVDPAEAPLRPASPRKLPILLFALVFGIPLGCAAAIGRELVDDRVKTPDEIKNVLGLKFLGFAPAVRGATFTARGPLVNGQVPPLFSEALRTVRANVFLAAASEPGTKVLLITSTGPNEGKTIVSSNLAVALAQSGRRVLLVDADLRLSKVHEVFEVAREPGFSNVLQAGLPLKSVIRASSIPSLSIVTAGMVSQNAGDLIEAEHFQAAIAAVQDDFDWIVIDSPPVLAVSDVIAMVPAVTGVVFVVGAQMTGRRSAEAALEQLEAADAKILGAVLSRADVLEHSPYYNSSYVRYHGYPAAR